MTNKYIILNDYIDNFNLDKFNNRECIEFYSIKQRFEPINSPATSQSEE